MKRKQLLLIFAFLLALFASCAVDDEKAALKEMKKIVTTAELGKADLSDADWAKLEREFKKNEKIVSEVKKSNMSAKQKIEFMRICSHWSRLCCQQKLNGSCPIFRESVYMLNDGLEVLINSFGEDFMADEFLCNDSIARQEHK